MIIFIDAEKAFDRIQHPFMIKAFTKFVLEGMILNTSKAVYDILTASSILYGEKLEPLPAKFEHQTRMPPLTTDILYSSGSSSQNQQVIKRNQMDTN